MNTNIKFGMMYRFQNKRTNALWAAYANTGKTSLEEEVVCVYVFYHDSSSVTVFPSVEDFAEWCKSVDAENYHISVLALSDYAPA